MLAIENTNITRNFLFSMKSILLLLQTLLIILILITRQEYIYRGINPSLSTSSSTYKSANYESIISSSIFFVFLLLEFFSVLSGISSKFLKISSMQALLHVWGVLFSILFIVERFHYRYITVIALFFGFFPFVLELFALMLNCFLSRLMGKYMVKPGMRTSLTKEEVERRKRKEARLMEKMRRQREEDEQEDIRRKRQEREDQRINDSQDDDNRPDSRDDRALHDGQQLRVGEDLSDSRDRDFQSRNDDYGRSRQDAGRGRVRGLSL